ncbi:MAG TPA: hypothetical protein VFC39_14165 [Acidobacteriaceae bacterium]|nr:hypothetical protein [Acidobacteriaceae bacterium]
MLKTLDVTFAIHGVTCELCQLTIHPAIPSTDDFMREHGTHPLTFEVTVAGVENSPSFMLSFKAGGTQPPDLTVSPPAG